jgi:hypothetical protein
MRELAAASAGDALDKNAADLRSRSVGADATARQGSVVDPARALGGMGNGSGGATG